MQSTIAGTLDHILLLARHLEKCNAPGAVIVMLMELGVPTQYVGFEFLKTAILLFYANPTRALHKDIYRQIMEQSGQSSEEQVDQAIRVTIKYAWREGSREAWDWYFAYDGIDRSQKPTNAEFISRIARLLEMWYCNAEEVAYEHAERRPQPAAATGEESDREFGPDFAGRAAQGSAI